MGEIQTVAVWGSPGAGKTTTAIKLASELAGQKKNVVVVLCDFIAPAAQTLQPHLSTVGKSLGDLLTQPAISQEAVLSRCIPLGRNPYISLLGYQSGDNAFTYAQYAKERAVDLLTLLRHCADYVLLDCSSGFSFDVLSAVALENADAVLRLCTCDLKSLSYFNSALPLLADARYASGRHVKALSAVKPGQDSGEYENSYGGVSYCLPYVKELAEQFYTARLAEPLSSPAAKTYRAALRAFTADVLQEGKNSSTDLKARDRKPSNPRVFKKAPAAAEKQESGLFDKLSKGGPN